MVLATVENVASVVKFLDSLVPINKVNIFLHFYIRQILILQ